MGNCVVSRSAREERYMGVDVADRKKRGELNKKISMASSSLSDTKADPMDPFSTLAEATEQETTSSSDMGDATAPLSPDFSLSSPSPQSPQQQQQQQEQSPYMMHVTSLMTSRSLDLERDAADEEAQDVVSPLGGLPSPRRPSRA